MSASSDPVRSAIRARLRELVRRAGLCQVCKREKAVTKTHCEQCRKRHHKDVEAYRERKVMDGKCVSCSRFREPERQQFLKCARCAANDRQRKPRK